MLRMLLPVLLVIVAVLVVHALTREGRQGRPGGRPGPGDGGVSLRRARAHLQEAQERYDARLGAAEAALAHARQDEEVLRLGPVLLGRCTVQVAAREHDLTHGTSFALTADGHLVLTGADWEEKVAVQPADLARAEGLVAAGRAAARSVEAARQERASRVQRAWVAVEEARADHREVDEARMTVEDLEGGAAEGWGPPGPPPPPAGPPDDGR